MVVIDSRRPTKAARRERAWRWLRMKAGIWPLGWPRDSTGRRPWQDGINLHTWGIFGRLTSFKDWPDYKEPPPTPRRPGMPEFGWADRKPPATFWTKRGLMLRASLQWVPRDLWVGLYFPQRSGNGSGGPLGPIWRLYIGLVPTLVILVELGTPRSWREVVHGAVERKREGRR